VPAHQEAFCLSTKARNRLRSQYSCHCPPCIQQAHTFLARIEYGIVSEPSVRMLCHRCKTWQPRMLFLFLRKTGGQMQLGIDSAFYCPRQHSPSTGSLRLNLQSLRNLYYGQLTRHWNWHLVMVMSIPQVLLLWVNYYGACSSRIGTLPRRARGSGRSAWIGCNVVARRVGLVVGRQLGRHSQLARVARLVALAGKRVARPSRVARASPGGAEQFVGVDLARGPSQWSALASREGPIRRHEGHRRASAHSAAKCRVAAGPAISS